MLVFPLHRLRAAGLALVVLGCIVSCQPKVAPVSYPHLERDIITLDYLFEHLAKRQAVVKDLKSIVRTKISGGKIKQSFKQALIVRGNDSIRLDTLGLFGRVLGVFIHDGGKTLFYDPKSQKVFREQKVWEIMYRMTGTHIDFREYISVFSGNIPRLENLRVTDARLSPDKKVYRLNAVDTERRDRVEIEIDAFSLLPSKLARSANGRRIYTVRWQDYRKVGDHDFPHRLIIDLPGRGETVTIKYSDPIINSGVSPDALQISLPHY